MKTATAENTLGLREGYGFRMRKKIYASAVFAALFAAALVFYLQSRGKFKVWDEFGIERHRFPYVKWAASSDMFHAEVSEILDNKSFRTKKGAFITLFAASPLGAGGAKEFMKNNIYGRPVVVSVCGAPEDYSGLIRAIVFYDGGTKCLNKDLYDAGFIDVRINNEFLNAQEWFHAEAD